MVGRTVILFAVLASLFIVTACMTVPSPGADASGPAAAVHTNTHAIENFYQLSDRIYSGSQPEGDVAFDELAKLGIRTIITLDGATPDIDRARARGMRYVHLPIGYDQVPPDKVVLLAQAMKQTGGKVFVHCHHGKHRGPAGAAVCAIVDEGWSNEKAIQWMKQAGTSDEYPGLYRSIRSLKKPDPQLLAMKVELPERSPVPALAAAMVQIDKRWDHLLASRAAKFGVPAEHPDIDPPHEAVQLAELLYEQGRTTRIDEWPREMLIRLKEASAEVNTLADALRAVKNDASQANRQRAEQAMAVVGQSCKSCHARYRN